MQSHKSKGYVACAGMQHFNWKFLYSAIYMVWCVGYLNDQELITFLCRAKSQLISKNGPKRRSQSPKSFIFVLDNLLLDEERAEILKG